MNSQKIIFVTGGTGNQGGAVARNLASNGFHVRVLTRNTQSPQCQELRKLNIETVIGNLDQIESYREYVRDAYGVFSVQTFTNGVRKEIEQGKTLANVAARFGVKHFIYSSVAGAHLPSGIPHFESKFEIEEHIKNIGLPYTILRPVSFYENFLNPKVKNGILKGKLIHPAKADTVMQLVACDDIGKCVLRAFLNPGDYQYKTFTLSTEKLSNQEVASQFSNELNIPVKYKKLPWLVTRLFLGKDINKMFSWLNAGNLLAQDDEIAGREILPEKLSLKQWIAANFKDGKRYNA